MPFVLLTAIAQLGVIKVWRPDPEIEGRMLDLLLVLVAAVAVAVLLGFSREMPKMFGALALDRRYGLKSRVTNALSFARLPACERDGFVQLAIKDALRVDAKSLKAAEACPLKCPPRLGLCIVLVFALGTLAALEVRSVRTVLPARASAPLLVTEDDLGFFREWSEQVIARQSSTETLAAVHRFNRLVQDLAERRMDRREALRRIAALERSLLDGATAEREALEKALNRLAEELNSNPDTKAVAKPLYDKKLDDSADALEKLAESLRATKRPSKGELERLRKSLDRASKAQQAHAQALNSRRTELEKQRKRLLKKKQEQRLTASEQQELESADRQLKRLDRERQQAEMGRKQLSELERQLANAARDLMKDLGLSAQELTSGAQNMRRLSEKAMSQKQQQELLERLRELREMLRQQGQGGQNRQDRLRQFSRRARGQDATTGSGKETGTQSRAGRAADGNPVVALRQGSAGVQLPMRANEANPTEPGAQVGGDAATHGGETWGTGAGPEARGDLSSIDGQTHDVSAVAQDTGQGSASSEVIQGAAERGFVGHGYRDVYTAYQNVAERALENDEIPPGYKHYVQRYFQLIRPRE